MAVQTLRRLKSAMGTVEAVLKDNTLIFITSNDETTKLKHRPQASHCDRLENGFRKLFSKR